jgi:anti-sigma factor RsiW
MAVQEPCQRCREWVSLSLDRVLSVFETALMRRHLERCPECAVFAAEVRAVTELLRAQELVAVPTPVELPGRRVARPGIVARTAVVAAGVAAVAALAANGLTGSSQQSSNAVVTAATGSADLVSMRLSRRQQLMPPASADANMRIRVIEID